MIRAYWFSFLRIRRLLRRCFPGGLFHLQTFSRQWQLPPGKFIPKYCTFRAASLHVCPSTSNHQSPLGCSKLDTAFYLYTLEFSEANFRKFEAFDYSTTSWRWLAGYRFAGGPTMHREFAYWEKPPAGISQAALCNLGRLRQGTSTEKTPGFMHHACVM